MTLFRSTALSRRSTARSIGTATNYSVPGVGNDGRLYVGTRDGHVLAFGSPVTQPVSGSLPTFSATTVGSSTSQTLTLTAKEPVEITGISSSSGDFTVGTPSPAVPASLNDTQTLSVPVTFSPTQPGLDAGQITVSTNAGAVTLPVSGTGQSPSPQLQGSVPLLSLGGTAVGSELSGTVSFSNVGNAPLTIDAEQLPGPPFSATDVPAVGSTINPGRTVTADIAFDPTEVGSFNDTIELDSTTGGDVTIGLSASAGTPGALRYSSENVDFGDVAVGTTATRTFTVTNTGGTDVNVLKSKPPFGGEFAANTTLPEGTTVTPGESITETVTFAPTITGAASGSWQITGDDNSGLQQVQFTGTGVPARSAASAASPSAPPPLGSASPVIAHHPTPIPHAPHILPAAVAIGEVSRIHITFQAPVAAIARFALQREVIGRRGAHGCVPETARNRHAARCKRFPRVAVFTHRDSVGANRLRLVSMVTARRLTPRIYRLRSVLYDPRGIGHVFYALFRIKPAVQRHPRHRGG